MFEKFDGDYDKRFYVVKLPDGEIIKNVWPNAWFMQETGEGSRKWGPGECEIRPQLPGEDEFALCMEPDFRISFLDFPLMDLKLDSKAWETLGDGKELEEKLKDLCFQQFEENVLRDEIYQTKETIQMLSIIKQKYRQGIQTGDVQDKETLKQYFRRRMTVKFIY